MSPMLGKEIIIETLKQIQRDRVTATPNVYAKTFCQIAKKAGLDLEECRPAETHINRLPEPLKSQALTRGITQYDELLAFLIGAIQRGAAGVSKRDAEAIVRELTVLLTKALAPSFTEFKTFRLNATLSALEKNPALALDKTYQSRIVTLIGERIKFDRAHIKNEAGELKKSVLHLYDLLSQTNSGLLKRSSELSEFVRRLEALGRDSVQVELFGEMKNALGAIAESLRGEAGELLSELEASRQEINALKAEISAKQEEIDRLSGENTEDYLNDIGSRKGIDAAIEQYEEEFEKQRKDYAVLIFDIDHFKRINDEYGRDGGDKILQALSELFKTLLPGGTPVGRYGSGEFVALLSEGGVETARKVCQGVEESRFSYQQNMISMTISCGVAFRSEAKSVTGLLREANARLYLAKKGGRNMVVSEGEPQALSTAIDLKNLE
jgi:diguanylate cyclase (GGDEF)-like protein